MNLVGNTSKEKKNYKGNEIGKKKLKKKKKEKLKEKENCVTILEARKLQGKRKLN